MLQLGGGTGLAVGSDVRPRITALRVTVIQNILRAVKGWVHLERKERRELQI